ncbi:MAG: penicillin-binding protein 2, partial [Myxococcota bacterium]
MHNLPEATRRWGMVRIGILATLLFAYAGVVTYRAYVLQVERAPALREMAEEQYLRELTFAPMRGTIYDRHGAELAVSVDVESVWANPRELREVGGDPATIAARLAQLTGASSATLQRRLESDRAFVWIKRRVSPRLATRIREAELTAVHLDREARRFYPGGRLASHVLGFANIDGVGLEGIELAHEDDLRGDRRSVPVIRDNRGRVVYSETFVEGTGHEGATLTLTIDRTIQAIAERELALTANTYEARSGSVVVMDPQNGEILALANWPDFDPNDPGSAPASHRRNRAVTDRFEPGSTVKPFTVAAALAAGIIRSDESIDCEGGDMDVLQYTIHDTSPHDELMLAQVLALSSNIGTAKIGMRMGRRDLYRAFRSFGFGERSGVGLPGETAGLLRPHRRWSEMDTATISFGQGMSLTSVQLATAMSAIANGGTLLQPHIVRRVGERGDVAAELLPDEILTVSDCINDMAPHTWAIEWS